MLEVMFYSNWITGTMSGGNGGSAGGDPEGRGGQWPKLKLVFPRYGLLLLSLPCPASMIDIEGGGGGAVSIMGEKSLLEPGW